MVVAVGKIRLSLQVVTVMTVLVRLIAAPVVIHQMTVTVAKLAILRVGRAVMIAMETMIVPVQPIVVERIQDHAVVRPPTHVKKRAI